VVRKTAGISFVKVLWCSCKAIEEVKRMPILDINGMAAWTLADQRMLKEE
jgi:hypothetical protein